MTKRQRVSEIAGTSSVETGALRLGVTRKTRTNLAPNPTCSVNTTGWTGNVGTGGGGTYARVASGGPGINGSAASFYRTSFTTAPSSLTTAGTTIGSTGSGASAIAVVPGWVAISAYARSSVADRTAQIQATFYNAAGAAIGTAINSSAPAVAIGSGWQKLTWLGEAPAPTARVVVRIYAAAGANYVNGSTFDTAALLVETNGTVTDVLDGYFDGDSSISWCINAWTGTAGASTSTAVYSKNLLTIAPDADTSTPANFPPGMSAWLCYGGTHYPNYGMLVVHKADAPASVVDTGICVQTLYPDADSTTDHNSKIWTRTWNDQLGWNNWTSAMIVSDKVGNDLYVQVAEPDYPNDGDLWISPGVAVPASSVTVAGNLFTNGNWYRIASSYGGDPAGGNSQSFPAPRASARFILEDGTSGRHQRIEFAVSMAYGRITKASVRTIDNTSYNTNSPIFTKVRITYKGTYDQWFVDVFAAPATVVSSAPVKLSMIQDSDWLGGGFVLNPLFGASTPATPANSYLTKEWAFATPEGSDNWTLMPYTTGGAATWSDYAAGTYEVGKYMLDYAGWVNMMGMVKASIANPTNSVIFTLPAGLRPGSRHVWIVPAGSGNFIARVDTFPSGDVQLMSFYGTAPTLAQSWVDLSTIRIRPEL